MENKNYYDWLEISKNASPEVVEKAYKALVKKYHPDLYEGNKQEAEDILKQINEAYDVLSDMNKRAQYDATLSDDTVSKEDYNNLKQELNNLKRNQDYSKNSQVQNSSHINHSTSPSQEEVDYRQQQIEYQRQVEAARQKAYHDAYVQDLRNRGYKIRYKKTFKDYVRIVITVLVLVAIAFIAWQIPFVRNWFEDLYNNNTVLKYIVDLFTSRN